MTTSPDDLPPEHDPEATHPDFVVLPEDGPADDDAAAGQGDGQPPASPAAPGDGAGTGELTDAYDCLQIRTPVEELEAFSRARLDTLIRLGEADRARVTADALELGLRSLREVMGSVRRGTS